MTFDKEAEILFEKIRIPLLFVECSPSSNIKISQDDSKMHLRLKSDKNFSILDEYELFEEMGLT